MSGPHRSLARIVQHHLQVQRPPQQRGGVQVTAEERGGLSDGNYLWHKLPVIDGMGPTGANAHCSEQSADGSKEQEYCVPSSFVPKTLLNVMAVLKLLNE